IGRYWPEGILEFLGRRDHQIKLRGHRIELGEIEAAIEAHPAVTRAIAFTTSHAPPRLAAAVVSGAALPVPELQAFLADRVPSYMVPAELVLLDALPLTANGKVDRRAIDREVRGQAPAADVYAAPAGELERAIASIWAELLGATRVSREENFFALGGDSLLATSVVAAIRRRLRLELSLRRLFAAPTVAGVAAALAEQQVLTAETVEEGVV
ncbi:MAG TPA: phosphopantetheine-binding protein, partial [Solirubrobacteraceae bacterium]|nr:phosphopantetheine-binding protein [Solirubrobacteraceae bacterium]